MRNFSLEDRMFIEKSLKAGLSRAQIASELKRTPRTISQEIRRRRTEDGCFGEVAHSDYQEGTKRRCAHMIRTFSDEEKKYIRELFEAGINISTLAIEMATTSARISIYLSQSGLKKEAMTDKIGVIERLQALEEQIKILSQIIKELKHDSKNK